MILKPCPFCQKDIPRSITVCPYCHRDEKGQAVVMDSTMAADPAADRYLENDLQELVSEDSFKREEAVSRVGRRGTGAGPALIGILSDFTKPGLAGVAAALGKIGDRRAIPALAQAAKMGDEELRLAAVWALAQFHEPEVLPVLLSEAERPHPVIQSFLAHALGTFQDSRVLPLLSKLTGHRSREVAFQAACAMGEIGDRHAIGALQKAYRSDDALVRAAGAASLRKLGAKPSRISSAIVAAGLAALGVVGAGVGWLLYK